MENNYCPICWEVVKNMRRLPCLHAFCLECLESYCAEKLPGDDVLCPLCRRTCPFPQRGLDDWKDGRDLGKTTTTCECYGVVLLCLAPFLPARRIKRDLCYGNVSVSQSVTAGIASKRLNIS